MSSTPASPEIYLDTKQRRSFALARRAAVRVLRRRTRIIRLLHNGYKKVVDNEKDIARVQDDILALLRFLKAWVTRDYVRMPWRSLLYAVAALIYFVNPIDLVPDALLGLGFVDDVAVVTAVITAIRNDLKRFIAWEKTLPAVAVDVTELELPAVHENDSDLPLNNK